MIGCFRDPHPDELFYSICARYAERRHYAAPSYLLRDLFGDERASISVDLPAHLDFLVAALPDGHRYTADRFIDDHSLLPFYAPFLPPERLKILREEMHANGTLLDIRVGLRNTGIDSPKYLRLCHQCVAADRCSVGEAYWHRIHQLPGVLVCPLHEVMLQDTPILRQNVSGVVQKCFSAEYALKIQPLSSSMGQLPWHSVLLALAKDAAWLLEQHGLVPGYQRLKQLYQALFQGKDLTTFRGLIHRDSLHQRCREEYPDELLNLLQCPLRVNNGKSWVFNVIHRWSRFHHPLRHLLVIRLLSATAETFFSLTAESPLFGIGPWPCLNPVCSNFRKPVIQTCKITYKHSVDGEPSGCFICTMCGFEYWRKGPDQSVEDRFRADRVMSRGPVWEEYLRKHWMEPNVTLEELASQMGSHRTPFSKYARRLGLPTFRSRQKRAHELGNPSSWVLTNQQQAETLRNKHRAAWLAARKAEPEAGIRDLMVKVPGAHHWLSYHDREWLQANKPPLKRGEHKVWVDWQARDQEGANAIRAAALRLRSKPGKPVHITFAAIIREIGQPGFRLDRLKKDLPLMHQAKDEMVESCAAFDVRRVWWAAQCYLQEHHRPSRTALVRRAGVGQRRTELGEEVAQTIDAALNMLANALADSSGGTLQQHTKTA
jgi:hypothetical protein